MLEAPYERIWDAVRSIGNGQEVQLMILTQHEINLFSVSSRIIFSPDWCDSVDWTSSCKPKSS